MHLKQLFDQEKLTNDKIIEEKTQSKKSKNKSRHGKIIKTLTIKDQEIKNYSRILLRVQETEKS